MKATPSTRTTPVTHHRTVQVNGLDVFYREAGSPDAPTLVLLHGAPASSFMFRDLIPRLARQYHVLAPDLIGFGSSSAPSVSEFDYSFDRLTDITAGFLSQLGVDRYALYVQDYGAPVGWRLALRNPQQVTAIITQNGNAYQEGFVDSFWAPLWRYAKDRTPENAAPLLDALSLEKIHWQYTHGVPDASVVSPDTWLHDHALVNRPGNPEVQLALFADYPTNVTLYPAVHEYFRSSQVPLLAVWGRNDEIFGEAGARAFTRDLPAAEVHLLDGGHFLLESRLDQATELIEDFLGRTLRPDDRTDPASLYALGEEFRAAQTAQDPVRLRALLHDEVEWVLPGDNAVSGTARGIDAIFERFAAMAGYGLDIHIEHVTAGRDAVALILHNTGHQGDRVLDEHLVSTLALRDGKIVRIETYLTDIDMMNAYFTR